METAVVDYSAQIDTLMLQLAEVQTILGYMEGFLLFFVVVVVVYFSYKFFRIFF